MNFASVLFHRRNKFVVAGVALACLGAGIYLTRSGEARVLDTPASINAVDQSALVTARRLAAEAHGAEEQDQAARALQVANLAVDQAFETALREAADTAPLRGEALATSLRIGALEATVEEEKQHVIALNTARLMTASQSDVAELGERAQAQLDLDTNKLNELHRDLILLEGAKQARIQRELEEHNALREQPIVYSTTGNNLESPQSLVSLWGKVRAFFEMSAREKQLRQASEEAATAVPKLARRKEALARRKHSAPDSDKAGASAAATGVGLHALSNGQTATIEYDARIHDERQLAAIYGSWAKLTRAKRVTVQHGILLALAILGAIFLALPFGIVLIRRKFAKLVMASRGPYPYPVIAELVAELMALAIILIVIFGTPTRIPGVLGL